LLVLPRALVLQIHLMPRVGLELVLELPLALELGLVLPLALVLMPEMTQPCAFAPSPAFSSPSPSSSSQHAASLTPFVLGEAVRALPASAQPPQKQRRALPPSQRTV
jgi:hypothetical protein